MRLPCSCGASPVCVFTWQSRVDLTVKLFPHSSHLYGFSPVWIRTCLAGERVQVSVLHFPLARVYKRTASRL